MTDALFLALSALAIWSGWRVFRVDSMVRASFQLMVSFIAVGLIAVLLSAPYIGIATIFMMAVEMMVMALFMVMFMMNPAGLNPMNMVHQEKTAAAAGIGSFLLLAWIALTGEFPVRDAEPPADVIASLGHELLGPSMLIFETAGVTLLTAMIGSVILSSRRGRFGDAAEGSRPPGLVAGGEPAGRRPKANEDGAGHHHGGHSS